MRHRQKKVTSVLEANRLASSRVACHASQQINTTASGGHTNRIQWRANYITARPEVHCQLHNPTVHFQDHKSLLPPPIPDHTNPFHTLTSCSLRSISILPYHLSLGLTSGVFTSCFLTKGVHAIAHRPRVLHAHPTSPSMILSS
jgi:hypothetical protein